MAKNNDLINRYKILWQKVQKITPEIYAAFALILSRDYGWETVSIEELFQRTQALWVECSEMNIDMRQLCSDEVDIDVRSATEKGLV